MRDNTEMVSSTSLPTSFTFPPAPTRAKRFASMMYEVVLLFAVVFTAGYIFDTLTESRHALMFRGARQVSLFCAMGFYFLICWYRSGQTLPMKAWHIKLVRADGGRPRAWQLILRYILCWPLPLLGAAFIQVLSVSTGWASFDMLIVATPFLIFIPTWFVSDGQFLHDRWARTALVNVPKKDATLST
jgi:uncharacterized RDD family membrane protein YckC